MVLRGIDFGHVLGASGVQGFFGEGYWFHNLPVFGADFRGMTFVAKTATLLSRAGNMPLTQDFRPRSPLPACIKVKWWDGQMLNAVGLSNPSLAGLLGTGRWQERIEPFFISIMSLEQHPLRRQAELRLMVDLLEFARDSFQAPYGLQINLSCPNTDHDPKDLIREAAISLEIASRLNVPLMPKFSIASAPIEAILELESHPDCDAICVSNTIPFGWKGLDWEKVWGTRTSPLAHLKGGGLSGRALLPLVCAWIRELRAAGFTKPINGGGGIMSRRDIGPYVQAGASSIFLGSVAALRPWQVQEIIRFARRTF